MAFDLLETTGMCGIIGGFDLLGLSDLPEEPVREGMARMAARGPDGEGLFRRPGVIFGHRRLAVIDVAGGQQPLTDNASGATIIFNGEIFNYRSLRAELQTRGHSFQTASDTEVLLRAYLEWDTSCLEKLNGMFAFAIHDPRRRRLFMARDRLGIKPLYYSRRNGRLFFASSCAALLRFPAIDQAMDPAAVSHYLTTIRTTLGRRTLYRDIHTLLPGECLVATQGHPDPVVRTYWEIPVVPTADKIDPGLQPAAGRVIELLTDSVRGQLISDVPLGGFLSGGLDSAILARLAGQLTGGRFSAYSVGYDREGYNEWPFVRETAAFNRMPCREIHLDESRFPEIWNMLTAFKGMPLSTPNEVAIYELARSLKQDFTVALSGEGADEIFGGYTIPQFGAWDYDRARHTPPAANEPLTAIDQAIQRLYLRPYLLSRADHYFLLNSWIPFAVKINLLTPGFWKLTEDDAALFAFYGHWFERLEACTTFDAYMHIHARINLEGLLSRVDSSTMAASVEARVPYTDHRMAEYLFSLPDSCRIDWKDAVAGLLGQSLHIAEIDARGLLCSKRVLRHAFAGQVPESVRARPKMSFPVPFLEWFGGPMAPAIRELILDSPLCGSVLNAQALRQGLAGTAPNTPPPLWLWPVANLCLWHSQCKPGLP